MSNFQLSLIIIGALVLIVVIAYNAWTTRRNTPKRASPREGDKGQEPAVRQEPAFDGAGLGQVDAAQASAAEPHFEGHAVDARDALDLPVPQPERRGGLDPLIDVIAPIVAEQQVSGDAALAALPPTRRAGSKPFAIEGLNEATQQWETPVPGQRYQSFQAGVQLANRTGPLNEIEYSEFVMKTQAVADALRLCGTTSARSMIPGKTIPARPYLPFNPRSSEITPEAQAAVLDVVNAWLSELTA